MKAENGGPGTCAREKRGRHPAGKGLGSQRPSQERPPILLAKQIAPLALLVPELLRVGEGPGCGAGPTQGRKRPPRGTSGGDGEAGGRGAPAAPAPSTPATRGVAESPRRPPCRRPPSEPEARRPLGGSSDFFPAGPPRSLPGLMPRVPVKRESGRGPSKPSPSTCSLESICWD